MVQRFSNLPPRYIFALQASYYLGLIDELDDVTEMFLADKETKQYNFAVSAARARAELFQRLMDVGTQWGVINTSDAKAIVQTSPEEFMEQIERDLVILKSLKIEISEEIKLNKRRKKPQKPWSSKKQQQVIDVDENKERPTKKARLIRKVKRNKDGSVIFGQNKKRGTKTYDKADLSSEEKNRLSRLKEDREFLKIYYESEGIDYVIHEDGSIIPISPLRTSSEPI